MPCALMRNEDIAQVTEIDREAFPSMWPPVNYHDELRNRLAYYIIACDEAKTVEEPKIEAIPGEYLQYLASIVRRLFNRNSSSKNKLLPSNKQYIAGFAGFWMMADETHIINIAVREQYRRQGIGELLLISMIDLATELRAEFITLEVRASNVTAQRLYAKYGFTQVGVRRGYYTDNKEDGILMSTEKIASTPFQERLQQLKQSYSRG